MIIVYNFFPLSLYLFQICFRALVKISLRTMGTLITVQLLLVVLSLGSKMTITLSSKVKFVLEEISAGTKLDSANVLATKVLNSGSHQVTKCSLHCKVSWACHGYTVLHGICQTFFNVDIIADDSVIIIANCCHN